MKVSSFKKVTPIYTNKYLSFILQIISLDSGQKKVNWKSKCLFLTKASVTAALFACFNIYSFLRKKELVYQSVNISILLTDTIQLIFDYFQYTIDLYFVFKYGRDICVEYYNQYQCLDKILSTVNYEEVSRRQLKLLIGFLVCWSIVSTIDFIGWDLGYGWYISAIYSPAYIYMLMKILTNLDLTGQVINIECRLRVVADIVHDYYCTANGLPQNCFVDTMRDPVKNKNWFYAGGVEVKSSKEQLKIWGHPSYHEFKWLSRCYLLLTEQCVFISRMFGTRILLNSLSLLIDMVRFLNVAVRISVGSQNTPYDAGCVPVVAVLLRTLECTSILTSLVHHCEKAYRQRDRIVFLTTHLLINKEPDGALRAAVTELRDLVSSTPIQFTVAHFFTLNYSYLLSMTSIVVTYTIILLQSM